MFLLSTSVSIPNFDKILGFPIPDNSNILGDPIDPEANIISLFTYISSNLPFLKTCTPLAFLFFKIILLTSHLLITLKFFLFLTGFKKALTVFHLNPLF